MVTKSLVVIITCILLIYSAYAITGSIGNARMILTGEVGDTIERSILVKNVNNVSLDIELTVMGELIDSIDIKDESFRLEAGEERKAYFEILVRKAGSYESQINVKFSPVDGGNGVGLSSTIILNAYGEGEIPDDEESDGTDSGNNITLENKNINPVIYVLGISTVLLAVIFILVAKKALKKKKRSGRSS